MISRLFLVFGLVGMSFFLLEQALNYYFGNLHSHSGYSDGNRDFPLGDLVGNSGLRNYLQDSGIGKGAEHADLRIMNLIGGLLFCGNYPDGWQQK